MSSAEIIRELPKLSEADRRAVRQKLVELAAAENEEVAACDRTALEGALMLDRVEEEEARRQSR